MSSTLLLQAGNLLADAGMTVLIGVVVVFGVLLVLTFVFWLFGVVARAGSHKPAATKPAPAPKPIKQPAPAPAVDDGVPEEVVAVIAAAIAAMSDGATRYAVRRISPARSQGARPVWAAAGIADNTQPF
ncbi:MAG: OadG family protein [Clostridia bacterium]|nr:OadG family protein [Clostridia bacterium]